jgi:VanZ family protein
MMAAGMYDLSRVRGDSAAMESAPTSPSPDQSTTPPSAERDLLSGYRLALAIFWTLVIMTLCWLPRDAVSRLEDDSSWLLVPNLDKVVHAGMFIGFTVLWVRASCSPRRLFWIALGGIGLAVATEVGQALPAVGRDASVADGVTDVVGVVVGLAVAPLIEPAARFVEKLIIGKTGARARVLKEPAAGSGEVNPRT